MDTKKGIQYILLSGLSFLIVNFMVKLFNGEEIPGLHITFQKYGPHELVFFRSLISFSISAYFVRKRNLPFFGNNKKWLLIRGFAGITALTTFFFTLQHLPLAISLIVQYLSPIFTVILTVIFLKEKVVKTQWLFIFSAFAGLVVIGISNLFFSESEKLDMTWLTLGVFASAFAGIAYLAIVKLKPTDSPVTIVMYFPMLALPIMGVWCLFDFVFPIGWEWGLLLFIGIFTQIAQILMTKALHAADTAKIVPFKYLGAIYGLMVGWFVFDERLNFMLLIGVFIILVSVVANGIYQYKAKA